MGLSTGAGSAALGEYENYLADAAGNFVVTDRGLRVRVAPPAGSRYLVDSAGRIVTTHLGQAIIVAPSTS